jgi:hypothetical protein
MEERRQVENSRENMKRENYQIKDLFVLFVYQSLNDQLKKSGTAQTDRVRENEAIKIQFRKSHIKKTTYGWEVNI